MTINPAEYVAPEAPLTPRNDGKVEFLGPDTVKYISPPRIETARCRTAPPPPVRKEPPPYHVAVPSPPTVQYPVVPVVPPPQIIYAVSPPVHQHVQPVQQASPPSITVNVNASPQSVSAGSVGGGGGALVCPKCRKGIVTRQQDRFRKADVTGAAIRFFAGVLIAGSVLWAIFAQRAELLVPYLLLQGAGLAVGLVFFVSFTYIGLFGDKKVGTTVLGSYGIHVDPNHDTAYYNYAAWLMAGSFAIVIFLQIWMMCIVVACWRFFRDKRNNEKHFKEIVTVQKIQLLTRMRISLSAEALGSECSHNKNWLKNRSFSASLDV